MPLIKYEQKLVDKKIKVVWNIDFTEDYKFPSILACLLHPFKSYRKYKSVKFHNEVIDILVEEVTREIDTQIIEEIRKAASEKSLG